MAFLRKGSRDPRKARRIAIGIGLGVVVAAILFVAIYVLPIVLTRRPAPTEAKDVLAAQNAARTALLGALVAAFTAATLIVSWRSHRVAQTGQVTARFAAAVEQLGSASAHVRVGGIYSLERLMRDSEADHGTVVEVLSTFVRDRAPRARRVDPGELAAVPMLDDAELTSDKYARPETDVDAAIRVLVRREPRGSEERIDFRRVHLVRLEASRARLAGARLSQADLSFANLTHSVMPGGTFRESIVVCSQLDDAQLDATRFDWAVMNGASAQRASFRGAVLRHARAMGVDFRHALFEEADLSDIDLSGAWLDGAVFRGASLRRAVLRGCRCTDTDFRDADLADVDMAGARVAHGALTKEQERMLRAAGGVDWQ